MISLLIVLLLGGLLIAAFAVPVIILVRKARDAQRRRTAEAAQYGWFPGPPNPWLTEVAAGLYLPGRPGAGDTLVSWGHGSFAVEDVRARLEAMTGLIERIPPYVFRDYGLPTS